MVAGCKHWDAGASHPGIQSFSCMFSFQMPAQALESLPASSLPISHGNPNPVRMKILLPLFTDEITGLKDSNKFVQDLRATEWQSWVTTNSLWALRLLANTLFQIKPYQNYTSGTFLAEMGNDLQRLHFWSKSNLGWRRQSKGQKQWFIAYLVKDDSNSRSKSNERMSA